MIPKFLVCDSHAEPEKEYVLHTQKPRFLAQSRDLDGGEIELTPVQWYDDPAHHSVYEMARLMRLMGDWFAAEIASYED